MANVDDYSPLNIIPRVTIPPSPSCVFNHRVSNEDMNDMSPSTNEVGPLTILLVRHGESLGNSRPEIYQRIPDHAIPLTERGKEMAIKAGQVCRQYVEENCKSGPVKMWVSPFLRTRQTAECMLRDAGLSSLVADIVETPLLVEQDWGVFEGVANRDADLQLDSYLSQVGVRARRMKQYGGSFYARWPMGESCFDVCIRTQQLFHRIIGDWKAHSVKKKRKTPVRTVIIVSHGVTIRSFTLMWCQYPPEYLDVAPNPPNCSIRLLCCSSKNWDAGFVFGGFDRQGNEVDVDSLTLSSSNAIASFCVSNSQCFRGRGESDGMLQPRHVADNYRMLVQELVTINYDFYSTVIYPVSERFTMMFPFYVPRSDFLFWYGFISVASIVTTASALTFLAWKRWSQQ